MTDLEKKAEEYVLYIPDTVDAQHSVYSEEKLKQAYKDGYEQGQKDGLSMHLNIIFNDYKKENEELKKEISSLRTTGQDEYINALEEQYEELKKENEELKAKLSSVYNCIYCGCSNCDFENCQMKRN